MPSSDPLSSSMKLELQSASNFLVHLVKLGRSNLSETQLDKFQNAFVEVLQRRYRDHWFPEKPFKGSGYRCIRINGKLDPVIVQAGEVCGISPQLIRATFPSELTMWIDPLEVSYRIGENGSVCVLYEFKNNSEPWKPKHQHVKGSDVKSKSAASAAPARQKIGDELACTDSVRAIDLLLDPRQSVAKMEQLAAYS